MGCSYFNAPCPCVPSILISLEKVLWALGSLLFWTKIRAPNRYLQITFLFLLSSKQFHLFTIMILPWIEATKKDLKRPNEDYLALFEKIDFYFFHSLKIVFLGFRSSCMCIFAKLLLLTTQNNNSRANECAGKAKLVMVGGKWHVADERRHLGFYLPRKVAFEWENLNSWPKSPDNCPNWDFSMQLSLT